MGTLRRVPRPAWIAATMAAAIGPILQVVANALQGESSIKEQSFQKLKILMSRCPRQSWWPRRFNLLRFATDTGSYYLSDAWTLAGAPGLIAAVAFALAAGLALVEAFRFLRGDLRQPLLAV